jgi:hypothetical protein
MKTRELLPSHEASASASILEDKFCRPSSDMCATLLARWAPPPFIREYSDSLHSVAIKGFLISWLLNHDQNRMVGRTRQRKAADREFHGTAARYNPNDLQTKIFRREGLKPALRAGWHS